MLDERLLDALHHFAEAVSNAFQTIRDIFSHFIHPFKTLEEKSKTKSLHIRMVKSYNTCHLYKPRPMMRRNMPYQRRSY